MTDSRDILQPANSDRFEYEPDFIVGRWSPGVRMASAATGVALLGLAIQKRGAWGALTSVAGLGLLARAITNRDLTSLFGTLVSPVLRMRRSIEVAAPVEEVFDFWRNFSNFPKFMSYIRNVSVDDSGTLTWTAKAPGGTQLRWRTRVLAIQPNQKIIWKSIPGALVATEGIVQMHSTEFGTRLEIELLYAPPAGALGYAVAHILGFDPRGHFEKDLQKMKNLIEEQVQALKMRIQHRPPSIKTG
jgi:uncharacterized membrane protein